MTAVDELLAFLRAQLDEDERVARAAGVGNWSANLGFGQAAVEDESGHVVAYDEGNPNDEQARHIARWDPARVVRLTTALRGAIDEFSHEGRETAVLMTLAEALYAGRPGWRDEWRA